MYALGSSVCVPHEFFLRARHSVGGWILSGETALILDIAGAKESFRDISE